MALEKILIVEDDPMMRQFLEDYLRSRRLTCCVAASITQAESFLGSDVFDLVLLDKDLPDGDGGQLLARVVEQVPRPVAVMITGNDRIDAVVDCVRAGAFDYITKPVSVGQLNVLLTKADEYQRLLRVNAYLSKESTAGHEMLGESSAMIRLRELIRRVARTDATVLICGENGTGKELVAREIFLQSNRSTKPFVKVNCAAISEQLMESEFFGHEKGAFTGATERREGRFEIANGGTILLDEISEIPIALQAKLLRVLQEREFERVGGNKTIRIDVRVVATSNRNLQQSIAEGEFREDLFYRLNVFPIEVPPLRERKKDIPLLARKFLESYCRQYQVRSAGFSSSFMDALLSYNWPGNVRELQNMMERAAILADEHTLIHPELPGSQRSKASRPDKPATEESESSCRPLAEVERRCIADALRITGGNRTRAAALLDISIRTLRNKLAEYEKSGPNLPG